MYVKETAQTETTVRGMRDTVLFTALPCPASGGVPQAESMVSASAAAARIALNLFIVVSPCPLSVLR